jgi:hypothetical protein
MEPRLPKLSPGCVNGAQDAQMEPRRPKCSPGCPNGGFEHAAAQEGPNGAQALKFIPDFGLAFRHDRSYESADFVSEELRGTFGGPQDAQMEPRRRK